MRLSEKFKKTIVKDLQKELGDTNVNSVPKVTKIVLNVGINSNSKDSSMPDVVEATLTRITGQKPVKTLAKKSISNFKIRQGMVIGMKVTLRGERMYDFMEKFLKVTLPRVRDFRGLSHRGVDEMGNYSVGLKENIAFPEIKADEIEKMHGIQITFSSNAGSKERGLALFKALGFPFIKK